jgi:hypothetical protein
MSKLTPEQSQILAELGRSGQGQVLRIHLADLIEEIGDVSECTSWEDTLGRQHAKKFIKEAFRFLDKPESTQTKKNDYT